MPHDMDSPKHYEVLDAMERYGGSFVVALAQAWRKADVNNAIRLQVAFPDYYIQYANMVRQERKRHHES